MAGKTHHLHTLTRVTTNKNVTTGVLLVAQNPNSGSGRPNPKQPSVSCDFFFVGIPCDPLGWRFDVSAETVLGSSRSQICKTSKDCS